jgi:6-phosphogluconolactonase
LKNFELISFASGDELASRVASLWLDEIESASRASKPHCVALSGGRIAGKFFASVVEQNESRKISFERVHFFWADERCVPPTDPESNFKLANELLFEPLKISGTQIHRIRGEEPPDKAAELATAEILRVGLSSPSPSRKEERAGVRRQILSNSPPLIPALSPLGRGEGENFQPILDLIFLGMGEDGHVASLFPGEMETADSGKAVYRAVNHSPKPPPNRITLGYPAIAAARHVWVLVSGAGKAAALLESLKPDGKTPLARVIQSRSMTKIFSDIKIG